MAIWKLTIEDDEGQKTVVPLVRDDYTIGRRDGHTIRLTERNVSRDHARIRKDGDATYLLEDLGSYNGVFINGHRVAEPVKIQNGDLILIGDYRIEAHNEEAPAVIRPTPSASPPKGPVTAAPVAAPKPRDTKPHRLVLLGGADGGTEFPLDKPQMTIGRGEEVDIRVNHSSVSRTHCELHTVDDEHFEVVDSGSANGIRVNGQDVKRALLSPGDTLELGDVRLKYVAAGQVFVYDAAAAEALREAEPRRRKGGATVWLVLGVVVLGAVAGGVVLAKQGGKDDGGGSPVTAAPSAQEEILAKAYKTKQEGDAAAAHAQIKSFDKDSPLRKDKRFVEIENAWADKVIAAVKDEPDVDKKKALLTEVLESGADQSYRTTAADLLSEVDPKIVQNNSKPPATNDTAPSVNTASVAPPPTTVKAPPTTTAPPVKTTSAPPPATTPTATAKPPPTATTSAAPAATGVVGNCPSWKGDYSAAMRAKDYDCVRSMLLPRLNSGAISQPEARYLKAACAALGDTACQKRAAEKL